MRTKLRALGQFLGRSARFLGRLTVALSIAIWVAIPFSYLQDQVDAYLLSQKTQRLILLVQAGPMVFPAASILVTNVSRKSDGSICYTNLQSESDECLKTSMYVLTGNVQ